MALGRARGWSTVAVAIFAADGACAPRPPSKDQTRMESSDQTGAEEAVLKAEAPAAMGAPKAKVARLQRTLPHLWAVDLDNGQQRDLLVLDGHVLRGRSSESLGRYLRALRFLETRALDRDQLTAIVSTFGELPPMVAALDPYLPGPAGEPASLAFDAGGALLTLFAREAPAPPPAPFPSQPPGIGYGGPRPLLHLLLRLDGAYRLSWQVKPA